MSYLHDITDWSVLVAEWDKIDKQGTDLAAIRALCKADLAYLIVKAFKRVDVMHPWLLARIREFEASPNGHLDLWSREHYKSTIITFAGSIQSILNDPEITIGIFSHTGGISTKFLIQIKNELQNNQLLKSAFPDILYQDPERESPLWNTSSILVKRKTNPKEATVEAHGLVQGMPTGRHFGMLVYDDVVTQDSVTTPEQVEKTTIAWELSLALGSEGCPKRYIGTRYSMADTYETMLERGVVKPRIYAATDNGKPDGNPVLFSIEGWKERVMSTSDNVLACQYLQDPVSGNERLLDPEDLQEYQVRPSMLNVYIVVDPARSKKKGSDNTAMAVIGVDHNLNLYLLDGINHRCDLQERWQWMKTLYTKWHKAPGVQNIYVGYEVFGAIADMDYFKEQMKKSSEPNFKIKELTNPEAGGTSKVDRVQRIIPDLKQHKIYLPYSTDENKPTSQQRRHETQKYLWSKAIKRKDSDAQIYDLSKQLRMQVQFFPFGKKDLIDAFARIYDMDRKKPMVALRTHELEPDF